MPKLIKENKLYCRCNACHSIMEYKINEIIQDLHGNDVLHCPACDYYFCLTEKNKINMKDLIKEMLK